MSGSDLQQLNVRIDATKLALLKMIAAEEGKSVNQVLDEEITDLIAVRGDPVIESMRARTEELEKHVKIIQGSARR